MVLLVLVWIASAWFMRSGVPAFRVCFRSAEGQTGASLARFSVVPGGRCGFVEKSRFSAFRCFPSLLGSVCAFGGFDLRGRFPAFRLGGGFCFPFCFADGTGTGSDGSAVFSSAVLRFCGFAFRRDLRTGGRTDGRRARFGDPLNFGGVGCRALWARVLRFCFRQ